MKKINKSGPVLMDCPFITAVLIFIPTLMRLLHNASHQFLNVMLNVTL